jgi:metal-responsive CopG/Arc/MetJ family transcriptional regulator
MLHTLDTITEACIKSMKTIISIETPLLEETDRAARKLGVSRSRLVSLALKNYLRQSRNREIVEQLNLVYGEQGGVADRPSPTQMKAKFRSIVKDLW